MWDFEGSQRVPKVPNGVPLHEDGEPTQCSRLKPSYEFHFEGLSNFSPSVERLV